MPHHEKIGFDVFEHGIIKRRVRTGGSEEDDEWKLGHPILFPTILRVGWTFQIRTPIDDTHTWHVMYGVYPAPPGETSYKQGKVPFYDIPMTDENGRHITDFVLGQDMAAWVTQGPTAERNLERLVGEDVLITGAGPIGIMAAAVAKHIGARHVVITDINQDRLDLANRVADVTTVNVTDTDLKQVFATLGIVEGFDIGLEMSGSQVALDQMISAMVMGGRIAMLGIIPGKSTVNWSSIVLKSITIKGVYGREIFETWYKMLAMLQNGLDVSAVITHRFKVDDFEAAFAAAKSGSSGKIVLDWSDDSETLK